MSIGTKALEAKAPRLRLAIKNKPYWLLLSGGISLGYRRTAAAGTWSVRIADGKGGGPIKRIAAADDLAPADGKTIMSFTQARDAALRFANGEGEAPVAITTLGEAIEAYKDELEARDGDPRNASRLVGSLPPAMLKRPIALITTKELQVWRNGLAKRLQPATVNRLMVVFKAVLNLAKTHSEGLNAEAWKKGLVALPNARVAVNRVLTDDQVRELVRASRALRPDFGLLVEVLAQTGARCSQLARCRVSDLRADRLLVPPSRKGKNKDSVPPAPLPLPEDLIARLRLAAGDRPGSALLLRKKTGEAWRRNDIMGPFARAVVAIGEDPKDITSYALRHTHITRQLLALLPTTQVAKLHDTSVKMIEQHYAAEIASQQDELVRGSLLQIDRPQANVVPLRQTA